jgi:hypothetical protein
MENFGYTATIGSVTAWSDLVEASTGGSTGFDSIGNFSPIKPTIIDTTSGMVLGATLDMWVGPQINMIMKQNGGNIFLSQSSLLDFLSLLLNQ